MSAIVYSPPASGADITALQTALAGKADASAMPAPATTAPPAVQTDSAVGSQPTKYALADHTHESRLQARRVQITFNASGEGVWTFPRAYTLTGSDVPIVEATAETPGGAAYKYDVSIKQGSTTNTSVTFILNKTPKSLTVSVLGAIVNLFTSPADTVWVNVMARAPST